MTPDGNKAVYTSRLACRWLGIAFGRCAAAAAALIVIGLAPRMGAALAQSPETWSLHHPPTSSHRLATEGAKLTAASGLSWPDGRQAVVTFWERENLIYRCIDYFNSDMQQTGATCYIPDLFK